MKIARVFRLQRLGTDLDSFYVTFWSLQKYLKNPVILHSQQVLDEFKPKLDFVINKFFAIEQERIKLRGQAVNNKSSTDQKMDIVPSSEEKSEYYPGFLKSRQLFDLQVFPQFISFLILCSWRTLNFEERYYFKSWL
jgi:THO complex subunit 1 transcription elongation factor